MVRKATSGRQFSIPALKTAVKIASPIVANLAMLGATAAIAGLCSVDDLRDVVKETGQSSDIRRKRH